MIQSTIHQFEEILTEYNSLSSQYNLSEDQVISISKEQRFIKQMKDDLIWKNLSDNEKQAKREAKINLLNKWSSQNGEDDEPVYEKHVVSLYSIIEHMLLKIENLSHYNLNLLRLKAYLIIEKNFINEDSSFAKLKHMDYYLWTNFFDTELSDFNQEDFDTNNLNGCFKNMYAHWPNRPYKEINSL